MLRLRLLPCVLATAAAAKTVDWEGMHPSSGANTKSADAGETVTFNWDETHDVWLMPDEAAYNSCTFTNAVERETEPPGEVRLAPRGPGRTERRARPRARRAPSRRIGRPWRRPRGRESFRRLG